MSGDVPLKNIAVRPEPKVGDNVKADGVQVHPEALPQEAKDVEARLQALVTQHARQARLLAQHAHATAEQAQTRAQDLEAQAEQAQALQLQVPGAVLHDVKAESNLHCNLSL